jgi:response regulator RpfG family c-di-GMP phosphodiesterase
MNVKSNNSEPTVKTILIVNDNTEAVELLGVSLKRANLHVVSAQNATQGMSKARREKPSIIILDTDLADLGALDFCRLLKENKVTRHIPVILAGTKIDYEDIVAGIAAGAHDYVAKPSDSSDFSSLIETQLARIEKSNNTDPVTKLPRSSTIKNKVSGLIDEGKDFALLYVDIHSVDAFKRIYGSSQADHAVLLIADVVSDAVQQFGNEDDFIAQLDQYALEVITTPGRAETLCRRMISDFENQMQALHQSMDKLPGHAERKGKKSQHEKSPIIKLSISVVTNEKRRIWSYVEADSIGAELRNHVKDWPTSSYFFDRRKNTFAAQPGKHSRNGKLIDRYDIGAMEEVLSRIALLTNALAPGIKTLKSATNSLLKTRIENLNSRQIGNLQLISKRTEQLLSILNELETFGSPDGRTYGISLAQMSLREIISLAVELVQMLAVDRGVRISINVKRDLDQHTIVDHLRLVQGLFFLFKSAVESSAPGNQVLVSASQVKKDSISVKIVNPKHDITAPDLRRLRQSSLADLTGDEQRIHLYLAMLIIEGLGGNLRIKSKPGEGNTLAVSIPSTWRSRVDRINNLQSKRQKSGRTARAQLDKIRDFLSSSLERVPSDLGRSLETVEHKIWELEVLNNLALLLADDFNGDLARQHQERIEQDVERLVTLESTLTFMRQISRLSQAGGLFDADSAVRTSRYAQTIAAGLRLPRHEQHLLHYAALLKDLGLAFAPSEFLGVIEGLNIQERAKFKQSLLTTIEALSRLDFLVPALSIISHKYERFDGTGYPSGLKGKDIPVAARVLALAEAFDYMTYGLWPLGESDQGIIMEQIIADSGRRFDPEAVTALLRSWRAGSLPTT